ncbi:MAG: hypothetical protein ACOC2H_04605 [Spirochaetota bacterium]
MKHVGIVIAVKQEASVLLDDPYWKWKEEPHQVFRSTKTKCMVALSGVGKVYASYALMLIAEHSDIILSVGTSASLRGHAMGDIVLCREFVEHDMDVSGIGVPHGVTPFSEMKSSIIHTIGDDRIERGVREYCETNGIPFSYGRSMSGDMFLDEREIAHEKYERFRADVADMESAAIAKLCSFKLSKPCIALRYVSDNADSESSADWTEEVNRAAETFNVLLKSAL